MLNVALTGNIAAGKSTVVELLRRWGATIIDADELTRQAQAPGGEVLAAIARRFGSDVLAPDGSLDRAALRSKVMGDQAGLDALNAIVHPAVRRRRDERAAGAERHRRPLQRRGPRGPPRRQWSRRRESAGARRRAAGRDRGGADRGGGRGAGVAAGRPTRRVGAAERRPRSRRSALGPAAVGSRATPAGRARSGRRGAAARPVP